MKVSSESASADVKVAEEFLETLWTDYEGKLPAKANIQHGWNLPVLETVAWKHFHP